MANRGNQSEAQSLEALDLPNTVRTDKNAIETIRKMMPDNSLSIVGFRNSPLRLATPPTIQASKGFIYAIPQDLQKDAWLQGKRAGSASSGRDDEKKLAEECDRESAIGVFRGEFLQYRQLVPLKKLNVNSKNLSLSPKEKAYFRRENTQLEHLYFIARSYTGWLLANPDFQVEQDDFLNKWRPQIIQYGFPGPLISLRPSQRLPQSSEGEQLQQFGRDFDNICIRWRLNGLVGPDLPEPLTPFTSGSIPTSIFEQFASKGGVFFYPDTFPIESRDALAKLLESGLGRDLIAEQNPHLKEWHRIVSRANAAKNQLGKFEKIRKFIHYSRLVNTRLIVKLTSKERPKLVNALAKFLKLELKTIKNYQSSLSERLGANWDMRVAPLIATELSSGNDLSLSKKWRS